MNFRTFLEDDEWSEEDVLDSIKRINSSVKEPFDPPEYTDPDDLYNSKHGFHSGFTFTYSNRLVLNGKEYHPEGLQIDSPYIMHRHMVVKRKVKYGDEEQILSGRYGLFNTTPIVTIWYRGGMGLVRPAVIALWDKKLIHPESYLYIADTNKGKVKDFLFGRVPTKHKAVAEEKVKVGGKEYSLYELPAMLHYSPSNSPEHAAIRDFICNNHERYPFLKNFLSRAKCGDITRPEREPETVRRQRYWTTSESVNWNELRYIGSGCSGVVYAMGDKAVKIGIISEREVKIQTQLAKEGLALPVLEYHRWIEIPDEIKEKLGDEMSANRNLRDLTWNEKACVLVMPLGHTPPDSNFSKDQWREIQDLMGKINKRTKELGFVWDDTLGNITYYRGRWYGIDFGDHDRC